MRDCTSHVRAVIEKRYPRRRGIAPGSLRDVWPALRYRRGAIAAASANPRFGELLEFLGRHVIPRQSVRVALSSPGEQRIYLLRIQKEHARIYAAIRDRHSGEARKAMRTHLTRSLTRYRRLAERQLQSG